MPNRFRNCNGHGLGLESRDMIGGIDYSIVRVVLAVYFFIFIGALIACNKAARESYNARNMAGGMWFIVISGVIFVAWKLPRVFFLPSW